MLLKYWKKIKFYTQTCEIRVTWTLLVTIATDFPELTPMNIVLPSYTKEFNRSQMGK
jgi:hypothetical protein